MNLKTIVLLALVGVGLFLGYKWYQNRELQKEEAVPSNEKPTLLVFCTDNCVACNKFKKDAVDDFGLRYALAHYNVNYVTTSGKNQWNIQPTVYPTFVILGKNRLLSVTKKEGYDGPTDLVTWLNSNNKN